MKRMKAEVAQGGAWADRPKCQPGVTERAWGRPESQRVPRGTRPFIWPFQELRRSMHRTQDFPLTRKIPQQEHVQRSFECREAKSRISPGCGIETGNYPGARCRWTGVPSPGCSGGLSQEVSGRSFPLFRRPPPIPMWTCPGNYLLVALRTFLRLIRRGPALLCLTRVSPVSPVRERHTAPACSVKDSLSPEPGRMPQAWAVRVKGAAHNHSVGPGPVRPHTRNRDCSPQRGLAGRTGPALVGWLGRSLLWADP